MTNNRLIIWLFSASGVCALVSVFVYLFRIFTQKQAEFNVYTVLVIELMCFLAVTVLICERRPLNKNLSFLILYLFLNAVILIYPFSFLFYTDYFYLISIGLISFLSWLNALVFFLLQSSQ